MSSLNDGQSTNYLDEIPKLKQWFVGQTRAPTTDNLPSFHLWHMAKALRSGSYNQCRIWVDATNLILDSTDSVLQHILETDSFAVDMGKPLTDIYAFLAELAIKNGTGKTAFKTLERLADATGLAAFRFLSAWTAFNEQDIETCISECEKVDEPFAPIHTLLGQALLESGKVSEAIDALKVAAKIDQSDPLPRVQLIKAYLVVGLQVEAMRMIEECRTLVGDHIEVECLAAMTVLAGPNRTKEFTEKTLRQIAKHLEHNPSDFYAFAIAIELASELNRKDWGQKFVGLLDLDTHQDTKSFSSQLSFVLKKTGEREWYDVSKIIIEKTLNHVNLPGKNVAEYERRLTQ